LRLYLIKKFIRKIVNDDIFALSAQFSYYIILAIFPFILLVVVFLSHYSNLLYEILYEIKHLIPAQIYDLVYDVINNSVSSYKMRYFSSSIIVLLLSASSSSVGIIKGINKAYDSESKKNFIYMRFFGVLFILALMISFQLVLVFIVGGKYITNFLITVTTLPTIIISLLRIVGYVIPILLLIIMLSLIYKFIPSKKIKFSCVIPGALIATFGCLINSLFFSVYVEYRAAYYNNIYGNLSGIFILLLWINITSFIFLLGNEINAFIIDNKSIY
jgi:membrane protein